MPASNSTDQDTPTDAPTIGEVRIAIEKLKNGCASGANDLPPELLKCAIDPVSECLHSLFLGVWKSGSVPADWRDGIISLLYKGKGSGNVAEVITHHQ